MTFDQIKPLVLETVTAPASAARKILGMPVPPQATWIVLALVAILNGAYYALLLPGLAQSGMAVPSFVNSPVIIAFFVLVVFVLMVFLMTVSGRFIGGQGDIQTIGKITAWLQALRFLAQVVISAVSLVSPLLGWVASMALGIWGIWILLNFLAEAHGFAIPKAIGVMVMTFIGVVLIMSIFSAAIGIAPPTPTGDI